MGVEMNQRILRAISYARDYREFGRARDLLRDFVPHNFADEQELDRAWQRVDELESAELARLDAIAGQP